MLFHSTNGKTRGVTFPTAIVNGLAEDGGLFNAGRYAAVAVCFFPEYS